MSNNPFRDPRYLQAGGGPPQRPVHPSQQSPQRPLRPDAQPQPSRHALPVQVPVAGPSSAAHYQSQPHPSQYQQYQRPSPAPAQYTPAPSAPRYPQQQPPQQQYRQQETPYSTRAIPPSPETSPQQSRIARFPNQNQPTSSSGHGQTRSQGASPRLLKNVRPVAAATGVEGHASAAGQKPRHMPPPQRSDAGHSSSGGHSATAVGVAAGHIGGGYGPYAFHQTPVPSSEGHSSNHGYSAATTAESAYAGASAALLYSSHTGPEPDDHLHNPKDRDPGWNLFSMRGWLNFAALFILSAGLVTLFAGYPILTYFQNLQAAEDANGAWNRGGTNSTGQVPDIPGFPEPIDADTPDEAKTRIGHDGQKYNLVFSDEFNTDGRTFFPGDDPFFEAVDLHYWGTGDYEWYDPAAVTTRDGKLEITITEEPIHNLNFRSGMIQSWNKLCFTGGYIEVSVSLPGSASVPGFWPGAWTMGNLARAGYGATTDGTWPFSYNSCDVGTYRNQTDNGRPAAATTGGGGPNGELSYQPGQRLSACTCGNAGKEHPGPSPNVGRGGPEIDILEAQSIKDGNTFIGEVSQSAQVAPYDDGYSVHDAGVELTGRTTRMNSYKGGPYQQAVSGVSPTDANAYGGQGYATYGFEYYPGETDGFITWTQNNQTMWTLHANALGPNSNVQIGQRLISEEPMYMILNLGMSSSFQEMDWGNLRFPATYYVDHVRIYQREGEGADALSCDGKNRPTSKYINDHLNSYTNPELTTHEQAGYSFPRNSKQDGC